MRPDYYYFAKLIENHDERVKDLFLERFPELRKMKPNPYNWPIIKKYNYRIWRKVARRVYNLISAVIDILIEKKSVGFYPDFVDVKDVIDP